MKISWKTKLYGLIGSPIEYTLSPAIHNAAFESLKIDAIYLAFDVPIGSIRQAVSGFKNLGVKGFNVTIPHKISAISLLDEVESSAQMIGAVSMVNLENGKLVGYNTDGKGALDALESSGVDVKNKKVVVVGAGGAARAVSFTLASLAGELVILNRTGEKAFRLSEELTKHFDIKIKGSVLNDRTLFNEFREADIVVNATSVGMHPNVDETPIDRRLIKASMTVFDIVYKPLQTRLLRDAKAKGAKTVDGLGMLIYQALRSQEIWTGMKVKPEIMFQAAMKELRGH